MSEILTPGSRVVARHRLAEPDPATGAHLTDTVGLIVEATADQVTVRGRHGEVRIPRADIVLAKRIPPRPVRRGAPHRALSIEDLERVKVGAWPAIETERLGDWLLRAAGGLTHRANSALALGSPGVPLEDGIRAVEAWYASRSLRADFSVSGPVDFDPRHDTLGAALIARHYAIGARARTMTAAVSGVRAAVSGVRAAVRPDETVEVSAEPSAAWLAMFAARRGGDPRVARAILTGSPEQWFATCSRDGEPLARGRIAVSDGWAGIAGLEVRPDLRGRGIASAILAALLARVDTTSVHLDVEVGNDSARRLYARLGFVDHHDYVNLVRAHED